MNDERRILYISTAANFVVGIIIGIILFYGQLRSNPSVFDTGYSYNTAVQITDFFRVSWLNILWMFAIFIAHNILPLSAVHPIICVRGCAGSFSMMYILNFVGIREAVASVLPQCASVLPLLAMFSVDTVMKRRERIRNGEEPFSMKRGDAAKIFVYSVIAGGIETLFFRIFCSYLF